MRFIEAVLKKDKYEIISALDGEEAIAATLRENPDLILLDVMMPRLNGWEVTKILKNNPETMYIPIILITALDNISDKIKGLNLVQTNI